MEIKTLAKLLEFCEVPFLCGQNEDIRPQPAGANSRRERADTWKSRQDAQYTADGQYSWIRFHSILQGDFKWARFPPISLWLLVTELTTQKAHVPEEKTSTQPPLAHPLLASPTLPWKASQTNDQKQWRAGTYLYLPEKNWVSSPRNDANTCLLPYHTKDMDTEQPDRDHIKRTRIKWHHQISYLKGSHMPDGNIYPNENIFSMVVASSLLSFTKS